MKQQHSNKLSFKDQDFYIGIDLHKKQWTISVISMDMVMGKSISIDPSPKALLTYLSRRYPGGNYHAACEAGFSGFWAVRELNQLGIECMLIHPADVPTSQKDRINKNDKVDAKKLARSLSNNRISPIYIPEKKAEEYRYLNRHRLRTIKDQTRIKNRIKATLHFFGIKIPIELEDRRWSGAFINWLERQEFETEFGQYAYDDLIDQLKEIRTKLSNILKEMRVMAKSGYFKELIPRLLSIPGIGFITAMTLATELMDMKRFHNLESLANYVGLVPSISSSDTKEINLGITVRRNKFIRSMLIEAAWIAVKKDPALTMKFHKLNKRMNKNKAIVRIAKMLLSRVRHVWNNQENYVIGVVA
jgi:transposase